ncbi:hypothetical protein GCM10022198_03000 [Klugiella xanthotipulae]|uniref:Uncharacterized protein n=1 Tax=Klugiella xanthotipulae TaxID=244735 RepID=A0A543I723_9MICO|nr:hypothetical protein [Klugiella xanthotipulae]TQM66403.1 hypothetical protein FB466_1243 [Klugiella xanthotipulae]
MAKLRVHSDRVEIHLSPVEKALSFHTKDIVIRRADITSAVITDEPWGWIRGVRSPGSITPRTFAYGTWKFYGGKDFLLLRGRRRRAVVIDIDVAEEDPQDGPSAVQILAEAPAAVPADGLEMEPESGAELGRFSRIIISTNHATQLVTALRLSHDDDVSMRVPGKP